MSFDINNYLSWYIPRIRKPSVDGETAINLHASGVAALMPQDITPAGGNPWSLVERFEHKLAAWLNIPAEELCFTPGATGGTLLSLLTLAHPGEHILVELPIYEPMMRQAKRLNPITLFHRQKEENWALPIDRIKPLVSDKTAVIMITEPSNPSGTFAKREDILALARHAAKHNAYLLINEVYRGFTEAPSFHGEADNIIVVSSLSKLLGAYGFRLGWVSANKEITKRLKNAHLNIGMPTQPAAAYGLGILDNADEMRGKSIRLAQTGCKIVDQWVRETAGLTWTTPEGPGYGCLPLPSHIADDVRFAENLCDSHQVLVVPGTHFGVPNSIRISWLQSGSDLEEGLGRLARAIHETA